MLSRHIVRNEHMNIKWNKVTWYSTALALIMGIGLFVVGTYVGMLYQRGLNAMELAEGLDMKYPPIVERETKTIGSKPLFMEEGNIRNRATGEIEEDEWVLLYEKPDAQALTVGLIFTTESRCVVEKGIPLFCNTANFEQGERVTVMGTPDAEGYIVVERLEAVR